MSSSTGPTSLERDFATVEDDLWRTIQRGFLSQGEPLPAVVYHYTSAPAFYGILQERCIWATDCRQLGDPKEGRYADEMFADVVERASTTNESPQVRALATELGKRRRENLPSPVYDSRLFVASFSKNGNDLSQWRMYADDGRGFSMALRTAGLRPPQADWVHVIYDEGRLSACLHSLLVIMVMKMQEFATAKSVRVEDVVPLAAASIDSVVLKLRPFFKHTAYSGEAEWRLAKVVYYPFESSIEVRARGPSLISYSPIPIADVDGCIPLGVSYFGPAQEPDWHTAWDVVRASGHGARLDVGFSISGLPYRSTR